jgi:hypothetical protein
MRAAGIVITLIGAGFGLLSLGNVIYFMAITGGWSLGGFGRLWVTEIQSVTCAVAGILLVRQSRRRT